MEEIIKFIIAAVIGICIILAIQLIEKKIYWEDIRKEVLKDKKREE